MQTESEAEALVSEYLDAHDGWTSDQFQEHAEGYARRAELEHPINRAPSTIAAAAIYLAGLLVNEKVTQKEVTAASGVCDAAIRGCYQEMLVHEGFETPDTPETTPPQQEKTVGIARQFIRRVIR